jgi:hypothetical protein
LFSVKSTVRQGGKADVLLFAEDLTTRGMLKKGGHKSANFGFLCWVVSLFGITN